jgi:hypothetical protein
LRLYCRSIHPSIKAYRKKLLPNQHPGPYEEAPRYCGISNVINVLRSLYQHLRSRQRQSQMRQNASVKALFHPIIFNTSFYTLQPQKLLHYEKKCSSVTPYYQHAFRFCSN